MADNNVQDLNEVLAYQARDIGDLYELFNSIDGSNASLDGAGGIGSLGSDSIFGDGASGNPAIAVEQVVNVRHYYKLIRDFVSKSKLWTEAIRYHSKPDERYDMTLISQRVYGNRSEYIAVMASANLDSVEDGLPEQLLVLPTFSQLDQIKRQAGYTIG